MPKRTYQPKKIKRLRKHGFLARVATLGGRKVIKRRMLKGRQKITV
ncbi:50S ribosomal protein L34 [Candidatus Daviesbacteria bacterium]|nr:50S ribosomal protein L34 [Candidatus Daviesbacteria bacterium]